MSVKRTLIANLNYELDKVNTPRLSMKASDKEQQKTQQSSANFGLINLKSIFSQKRRKFIITATVKKNFHVSLTKHCSDTLQEANLYVKENIDDGT